MPELISIAQSARESGVSPQWAHYVAKKYPERLPGLQTIKEGARTRYLVPKGTKIPPGQPGRPATRKAPKATKPRKRK